MPSKGQGKRDPRKSWRRTPRFHRAFKQLGDDWSDKPQVLKQLERLIYGQSHESSEDVIRAKLLRKMVGGGGGSVKNSLPSLR